MIVCVCHRVSDRDIHRAVAEDGLDTFEELRAWTGAATQCGRCREMAGEVFEAARSCPGGCAGAGAVSARPMAVLRGAALGPSLMTPRSSPTVLQT